MSTEQPRRSDTGHGDDRRQGEGPNTAHRNARALAATAVAGFILAAAIVFASVITELAGKASGAPLTRPVQMLVFLLVMQTIIALASVFAASRFGAPAAILSWRSASASSGSFVTVFAVMAGVLGLYTLAAFQLFPDLVMRDLAHFRPVLTSDLAIPAFVALVIGAPLSEELLFRGFLMGVLRRSWLGFSGAALIATLGWTALHWGYTWVGLVEVFLAGLIFSWALWRSGSIIVPIVCHALYNATVLIVLWSFVLAG